MAGMDASFLTGGAGFAPPAAPTNANGAVVGSAQGQHIGVVALVLIAAVLLIILDRVGFRFAVTAGRR